MSRQMKTDSFPRSASDYLDKGGLLRHPVPPHLALARSSSQPSLTHSITDVSDEHATTPTTSLNPVAAASNRDTKSSPAGSLSYRGAPHLPDSQSSSPEHSAPPSFTERRQKRLSLSRSLQNLRDKATSQGRRRASMALEKPSADSTPLPPVPALPEMYRRGGETSTPPLSSLPISRAAIPPAPRVARPPSPKKSTNGIGAFFRKLTGRSKEERKSIVPAIGTLRRESEFKPKPVPQVAPPQRVHKVLAEMSASSQATERRHTYRKSLKRVPVPFYDPNEDVIIHRGSDSDDRKTPAMPTNAAEARAAALLALEGSLQPPPTAAFSDPPLPPRMTTHSDDSGFSEPIPTVSPPLVTPTLISGPKPLPDVDSDEELPPTGGLMRMSRKLSDFGTYESDDEAADVPQPLNIPNAPQVPGDSASGSPPKRPSRKPTLTLTGLATTPEDGPSPSTPTSPAGAEFGAAPHSPTAYTSGDISPRDTRFAGSRSAYVAPMGNGLAERHRSVGHADRIKASTLGRRLSHRPVEPPTSHDAYLQKQAELARRRASCKPMIHSRASIAAELTEVRDTQAKNVMETFFMS